MARRLAIAAPIVLAYLGFNFAVGGHWMPQTVGIKAHFGIDLAKRTWFILREWGELWGVPFHRSPTIDEPVLLLPFLLMGVVLTIRRQPILSLYAIGFPLALSLFQSNAASEKRYILYVVPFGMILAAFAWDQIDHWMKPRWRRAGVAVAFACLALQTSIHPGRAENYGWNVQNINKMQVTLAKFTRAVTERGDAVAVNDIGAMGYFSGRYVVDLVGLVTPRRALPDALERYRPKLLVIFASWFQEYARDDPKSGNYLFYDADSTHRYELLAGIDLRKNTVCGGNRMTAYVRLAPDEPSPSKRWLYVFQPARR